MDEVGLKCSQTWKGWLLPIVAILYSFKFNLLFIASLLSFKSLAIVIILYIKLPLFKILFLDGIFPDLMQKHRGSEHVHIKEIVTRAVLVGWGWVEKQERLWDK